MKKILVILFSLVFLFGCIDNTPPSVELNAYGPQQGEPPLFPNFTYSCSDLDEETVFCIVEVDNKVIFEGNVPPYPDLEINPFVEEGKHTIKITAVDSEGDKDSKELTYVVTLPPNPPPIVSIEPLNKEGRPPLFPKFNYNCYDPKGERVVCYIKIGNRIIELEENLDWPENETIVFTTPGKHYVEIIGRDDSGLESTAKAEFIVKKEIPVYIEELPTGVDGVYGTALLNAFKFWENKLGIKFVVMDSYSYNSETVYIDWAKEYAGETVGRAEIGGKRMIVGLGDSSCYDKYRLYKPKYVEKIAKHELGHILGFEHSEDEKDIMYPIIPGLSYSIDVDEEQVVPSGWYWFFPICSNFDKSYYRFIVNSDIKVDVFVVPNGEEYQKALDGKSFKFYRGCKEENTRYFNKLCEVGKKAGLVIINNNYDASRVKVRIINEN